MLKEAIPNMINLIEELNLDNIETIKEDLLMYFGFLEYLSSLRVTNESSGDKETLSEDTEDKNTITNETESRENCYELKRNLKGGRLDEIDLYVPETIIRRYGFEEGDMISAVHIKEKIYDFKLVERAKERKETNRGQINFCILSKQGSYLEASEYYENGEKKIIKCNGIPHTFLIDDETRMKDELIEGSLVDIAYNKDNLSEYRVIWKHHTNTPQHVTPLPSSYYKNKISKAESFQELETDELRGKKILLLGGQGKTEFERAIANLGGELIHADGSETTKRLESMVKSCDILITMILSINHPKAEKAKEFAKKYGKPFDFMDSRGMSNLIEKVKSFANT